MTILIITVILLIIGGLSYYKFIGWKDNKKYIKEHQDIFEAHKKIGYPPLTIEEQFRIIDFEDLFPIKRLTKYEFVPGGLLDHYLTITPDQYFNHLKSKNLIEKMNINKLEDKLEDGFYIEQTNNSFKYIFNDRHYRAFEKEFDSEDKLLKFLVYERLRMHAPKYKKTLKKKYYA